VVDLQPARSAIRRRAEPGRDSGREHHGDVSDAARDHVAHTVKAIDKAWSGMWWKGLQRTSNNMVKRKMTKEADLKEMNNWGMGQLAAQLGLDYKACREDDPRKAP
jgi:hypothetical protein